MNRLEGLAKLTGREQYTDDLAPPEGGMLWGMTVRSPVPRGRIKGIRRGSGVDWSRLTLVDHHEIPGPNEVYLIERDQPVLAAEETRHAHEAVLLIAGESREEVRRAVASVTLEIDPLPAALDFLAEPTPGQVQRGTDNTLKSLRIVKGDADAALARAHRVVEGVYSTGAQEHVYIEPNAMIGWVENGVVCVKGSMQCPYYVLNAMKHALARDESGVRAVQAPTGGGFGGKEDYPSVIALHAALLAMKSGRPVKILYDRDEDMAATTKRHPSRVRHVTGVDSAGRLVAQKIDVILDGGAYVTLSPVVLSRGIIHAAGAYACDHVRITGRAVLTNTVPHGAFRGFGAPQTLFALERHMDRVARAIGMDPAEFRRVNLIRDGQSTATGQVIRDGADRVKVLDRALEHSRFRNRRREHDAFNRSHPYLRRGVGLAAFCHGAGFTGSGESYLQSRVAVQALPDGRIEVLAASTEMGQGTNTVFTRIAAEHLGVDPSRIVVAVPDTARVPNSGPTVASRTTMVVGRLIERACDALREQVGAPAARGDAFTDAMQRWLDDNPGRTARAEVQYKPPPGVAWDDATYTGDAYGTFAWACYTAEVEVDLRTFAVRVTDFVAVQDIGTVIHPTLAKGQVQGGVVQGIGWALMEECVWKNGAMANNTLTNYVIPTSADVPPIRVEFLSTPYPHGAMGAKGLGELPIDGPAPAILNAVAHATGTDPLAIPLTPERLMQLFQHGALGGNAATSTPERTP